MNIINWRLHYIINIFVCFKEGWFLPFVYQPILFKFCALQLVYYWYTIGYTRGETRIIIQIPPKSGTNLTRLLGIINHHNSCHHFILKQDFCFASCNSGYCLELNFETTFLNSPFDPDTKGPGYHLLWAMMNSDPKKVNTESLICKFIIKRRETYN